VFFGLILSVIIRTTEHAPFDWTKYPHIDFEPISWLYRVRPQILSTLVPVNTNSKDCGSKSLLRQMNARTAAAKARLRAWCLSRRQGVGRPTIAHETAPAQL